MKYKEKLHTVASHLMAQQQHCVLPQKTQEAASQSSCLVLSCNNLQGQPYPRNKIKLKKKKKKSIRQTPFLKKKVYKLKKKFYLV